VSELCSLVHHVSIVLHYKSTSTVIFRSSWYPHLPLCCVEMMDQPPHLDNPALLSSLQPCCVSLPISHSLSSASSDISMTHLCRTLVSKIVFFFLSFFLKNHLSVHPCNPTGYPESWSKQMEFGRSVCTLCTGKKTITILDFDCFTLSLMQTNADTLECFFNYSQFSFCHMMVTLKSSRKLSFCHASIIYFWKILWT